MLTPESKIAERVIARHRITPPVDIEALVRKYADVHFSVFPFDADGISINLKRGAEKPLVVVNSDRPQVRQRFTLAHELGHVLIPWHIGTILDDTHPNSSRTEYGIMESGANAFAAELLMPSRWLRPIFEAVANPLACQQQVMNEAQVSAIASAFATLRIMPPGYVLAVVENGNVKYCARSDQTLVNPNSIENFDPSSALSYCANKYEADISGLKYIWWQLPNELPIPENSDPRDWRNILRNICDDLKINSDERQKLCKSINAVIAYANGAIKQETYYSPEAIYSASLQRVSCHGEYALFMKHADAKSFLMRKATDLFSKPKNS